MNCFPFSFANMVNFWISEILHGCIKYDFYRTTCLHTCVSSSLDSNNFCQIIILLLDNVLNVSCFEFRLKNLINVFCNPLRPPPTPSPFEAILIMFVDCKTCYIHSDRYINAYRWTDTLPSTASTFFIVAWSVCALCLDILYKLSVALSEVFFLFTYTVSML